MFGTLVVQLPVEGGHYGGALTVLDPNGEEFVWETAQVGGQQQVLRVVMCGHEHGLPDHKALSPEF
jgi:hypothetical protein